MTRATDITPWSRQDDELIRHSLHVLGHDMVPLEMPEPDEIRHAGQQRRRGRLMALVGGLAAAAAVITFVVMQGPGRAAAPPATGTSASTRIPKSPAPTHQLLPPPTATATPPAPAGCTLATIIAKESLSLNIEGLYTDEVAAVTTAQQLWDALARCDAKTVLTLAHRDKAALGFDDQRWEAQLSTPAGVTLLEGMLRTLSTRPGRRLPPEADTDTITWPRVSDQSGDPTAWEEAIAAGIITPADRELMQSQTGYIGWRLAITAQGRWLAVFNTGD